MKKLLTIAVDFDGTIVEHRYPAIGAERPHAFETLRALKQKGHRLILWTYRKGKELDEALNFCQQHGLEFWAVNKNYPEEKFTPDMSRKILADLYIDDRCAGGLPEWPEIFHQIHPNESMYQKQPKRRENWWQKLKGKHTIATSKS